MLVIGILGFLVAFFWFAPIGQDKPSFTPSNAAIPVNIPSVVAQAPAARAVDYSKILEKYKGRDVTRAATEKKLIALTFDGGGNADGVDRIIETLSKNSIRSTFFLTGQFVEKFPKAVEEIKNSGGEIANHTYSHKNFTSLSADEAKQEANQMKMVAEKNDISVVPFFRFPYGAYKKEDIALVNDLGYVSARWTVDSLGWQGKIENHDAEFVVNRVADKAAPGAIVLMHLGSAQDKSALDADALSDIIKTLREQGYQLVTLSDLFAESL